MEQFSLFDSKCQSCVMALVFIKKYCQNILSEFLICFSICTQQCSESKLKIIFGNMYIKANQNYLVGFDVRKEKKGRRRWEEIWDHITPFDRFLTLMKTGDVKLWQRCQQANLLCCNPHSYLYTYRVSHSKVCKVNWLWWGCTFDFFLVWEVLSVSEKHYILPI